MKDEDLHYLAGIVDADGSIRITVQKVERAKFGFYMNPQVHVTGSDHKMYRRRHELFRELASEVGASINTTRSEEEQWSQSRVSGNTAVNLLEELHPYLREKRPIAKRILEEDWRGNPTGQIGRSEEQWRGMVQAREDIKSMLGSTGGRKYDKQDLLAELG